MPGKISNIKTQRPGYKNKQTFLPATRSMLISKQTWKKLGGFDESLSHNEDYAFAKKIQSSYPIVFAPKAVVGWLPRKNLTEFTKMIYRFAKGDIQAGILRPKVILIFARYAIASYFFFFYLPKIFPQTTTVAILTTIFLAALLLYSTWAILKNKKYVKHGWYYLPVLQISSDLAVMWGSLLGASILISKLVK